MPQSIPTSLVFVSLAAIGLLFLLGRSWPWIQHHLFVHHPDTQGLILARLSELIGAVKEQTLWMKASPPVDENVEITLGVLQEIRDSVAELDRMSRIENPTEREIHTNIDELRVQLAKQHDSEISGLASIASKLEQSIKVQKAFLATIYGQDGSGYSAMDEGEQQIRETAERFRKVYGVSWEDAMERARNAAAVQSGPGMRDGV
jgi:hypothetical protein